MNIIPNPHAPHIIGCIPQPHSFIEGVLGQK
jgi:hypothetical protein